MADIKIAIDEERIIDAVVHDLTHYGRWEDGSEDLSDFAQTMKRKVEKAIEERVSSALGSMIEDEIRAMVAPHIVAVVEKGFPDFDSYGRETTRKTFQIYVREAIDGMFKRPSHYSKSWSEETARKAFEEHVAKAFKDEAEAVRAKVRAYVRRGSGWLILGYSVPVPSEVDKLIEVAFAHACANGLAE